MKFLVPILVFSLLALTVAVGYKYKLGNSGESATPVETISEVQSDPDTTVEEIVLSAELEETATNNEDEDSISVDEEIAEISGMGEVYSESEY